jgi:UDP-N-acetylglucosamine 1-carboxyvinyltransferase
MKSRFIVEGLGGERRLKGTIAVGGAKNAILKILPAAILFEDKVQIENVPDIEDVSRMIELLQAAGASVTRKDTTATVHQPSAWNPTLDKKIAERLRASIVMTGPLLARVGRVAFPFPGGCVLGERPIDIFLDGFRAMGATIVEQDSYFAITAKGGKLRGATIVFPVVSVTGTETLMMAALLAEGETVLENAAMEPEIVALADYLVLCGAKIEGVGTSVVRIQGGSLLRAAGKVFATPPDRIEAGSFIILAALAGEDVTITHCEPKHMEVPLALFARAGVVMDIGEGTIRVHGSAISKKGLQSVSVRTHEYPGFPTDLQAPMAAFLTQCSGEASILETIFDGRFRYVDDLARMGADMTVMNPHRVFIRGPKKLSRKELDSPDLRGGLAYLIAATVAEGTSIINDAYVIDRGYERIEERLQKLGLNIKRETV